MNIQVTGKGSDWKVRLNEDFQETAFWQFNSLEAAKKFAKNLQDEYIPLRVEVEEIEEV
jgi:hypothetical protein